jgi:anti-sigma factor RsiW
MSDRVEPGMTIECREVVQLVTDYLEDALDATTRTKLEAYLTVCDACAEYVRQIQATLRSVGHIRPDTLSPQVQADIVAAFRTAPR